jgi:pimeloyl-ACP methyl ester carboxylesterase
MRQVSHDLVLVGSMLRQGSGTPLVLFHGVLGGERMWARVVPLLATRHDTIALTALGHRGGRHPSVRPATVRHVIDDAERALDELQIDKAHFAGNSLGGWVALELARRGRALSVCAFSPAGFWEPSRNNGAVRGVSLLRRTIHDTRRGRPLLPLLGRSARFRRWAMKANAVHGDRLTVDELVALADDLLGCVIGEDLLATSETVGPMSPLPCPVTLAWSECDRVLPLSSHGKVARERLPEAKFLVLDGVGHVPMFDEPDRVAGTILETTLSSVTTR